MPLLVVVHICTDLLTSNKLTKFETWENGDIHIEEDWNAMCQISEVTRDNRDDQNGD